MPEIDIARAVDRLTPSADFRQAGTYELLVGTWRDERPVPSWEAIVAADAEISAAGPEPTLMDKVEALLKEREGESTKLDEIISKRNVKAQGRGNGK